MAANSGTPLPFHQYIGFAVMREMNAILFVMGLLQRRRPFHITNLVMTVYVFAVERMFSRRLFAKMFKKLVKTSKSELNSSSAVMGVPISFRVGASIQGRIVRRIFSRSAHLVRSALVQFIGFEASTAFSIATEQASASGGYDCSAGTFAKPIGKFRHKSPCVPQNGEAVESLPRQISEIVNGWKWFEFNAIFIVGHGVFSFVENQVIRLVRDAQRLVRAAFILPQTMRISMGSMQMGATSMNTINITEMDEDELRRLQCRSGY